MLKIKTLLLIFFCWLVNIVNAQLTTSNALSPAQLVQNILLGAGVTATNITYNGAPAAIGSFNGVNSNIGFASGVLMTSGIVSNAVGPNNLQDVQAKNMRGGDADLSMIMSTLSFDASILEFDFVATSDTLRFRYVFGSDEYMEYVSPIPGGINDGFGFFISGPGITGPFSNNAKNIAIIPGTTLPVTMFNLNLFSNSQYYVDNGNNGITNTPGGATVQYDGFTKPLTAIALLQCGQNYHIKIAIADGGDDIIDSGVFLEAGSFTIPSGITINPHSTVVGQPGQIDTVIYEGCGSVKLDLVRSVGACNLSLSETVVFTISGTAQNGADYSLIQNSVTFPPNVVNASFTINSLSDAIIEGTETVTITFPGGETITILIIDTPPLVVDLPNDTTLFCNRPLPITATVSGGMVIGRNSYSWINATGTSSNVVVNPTTTTTYYLTVTDTCGNVGTDSMKVTIAPYVPMQLTLSNDTTICEGKPVFLNANVMNGAPGYTYSWSPSISTSTSATVRPASSTNYILTVTDGCGISVNDNVNVTVIPIRANFSYTMPSNQQVDFINQSSPNAASYFWDFGDSSIDSTSTLFDPSHNYLTSGTYTIMLVTTNSLGCTDTAYQTAIIYPDFYFYYPNAFSPNSNGNNDAYKGYGVGIRTYKMQIFDRWGNSIFETDNVNTGWDGTYKGKKVEMGVYVVKFNVSGYRGDEKEILNQVMLIR